MRKKMCGPRKSFNLYKTYHSSSSSLHFAILRSLTTNGKIIRCFVDKYQLSADEKGTPNTHNVSTLRAVRQIIQHLA